jgi:erythromycin esterase-like protein
MRVRPGLADSYEAIFHATDEPAFLLSPLAAGDSGTALCQPRLHRAIGVIYRPQTERQSHWFASSLAAQYDALIHIDVTRAVEPLERGAGWDAGEPPETYPSAL